MCALVSGEDSIISEDHNLLLESCPLKLTPQSLTSGLMQDHELLLNIAWGFCQTQRKCFFLLIFISNTMAIHCFSFPVAKMWLFFSLQKQRKLAKGHCGRWFTYLSPSPGHCTTWRNVTCFSYFCLFFFTLHSARRDTDCLPSWQTNTQDFTKEEVVRLSGEPCFPPSTHTHTHQLSPSLIASLPPTLRHQCKTSSG